LSAAFLPTRSVRRGTADANLTKGAKLGAITDGGAISAVKNRKNSSRGRSIRRLLEGGIGLSTLFRSGRGRKRRKGNPWAEYSVGQASKRTRRFCTREEVSGSDSMLGDVEKKVGDGSVSHPELGGQGASSYTSGPSLLGSWPRASIRGQWGRRKGCRESLNDTFFFWSATSVAGG